MQEDIVLKKLDQHDKRFDEHDKKFDIVIDKLGNHEERLVRIEDRVFNVEQDVKEIKRTMATKDDLRLLRNDVLTSHDYIAKKLDDILQEQAATNHALTRHENKLNEHDGAIKQLQTDFSEFQTKPHAI